jgi:hypothetical protein
MTEYKRSQDFKIAQLFSLGETTEYPEQLEAWEAAENEKPGKRGNCHVCPANGIVWDGETQTYGPCPRCGGTGKVKENV